MLVEVCVEVPPAAGTRIPFVASLLPRNPLRCNEGLCEATLRSCADGSPGRPPVGEGCSQSPTGRVPADSSASRPYRRRRPG